MKHYCFDFILDSLNKSNLIKCNEMYLFRCNENLLFFFPTPQRSIVHSEDVVYVLQAIWIQAVSLWAWTVHHAVRIWAWSVLHAVRIWAWSVQ